MEILKLDECKNDTARLNLVRETISKAIYDSFVNLLGEENTVYIPDAIEPNGGTKICGNSIAVRVGEVTNREGFLVDSVAIISVTAKPWDTKETKRSIISAVSLDDIRDAVEAETAARQEKKAEQEKRKAEKIAKDKEKREKGE